MIYAFQTISKIVYGNGAAKDVGNEVRKLGGTRALVVTDKGLVQHGIHTPVMESLERHAIPAEVFSAETAEPTPSSIEECTAVLRDFKADIIVGMGGGSALDSAKAASLLAAHGGPLENYFGIDLVPGPCMPTILIPTTAGTGSEVTSISVLGDVATNSKKGIVSDHLYARTVFLDPELTRSLPPHITASTGIDAFVHAMESFVNLTATPITDSFNLQAMRLISANIRKAFTNGGNLDARAQMLYASTLAGMGFSNTQNGVIHAIAMAMPATYHLPHGLLIAAVAPMGIAFNCLANPEKYAMIAEILGCDPGGKNLNERAECAAAGFRKLLADLEIKAGLSAYGIKREDLRGIAERAAATRRLMDNNPRRATADRLEALLEEHFEG